MCRLLRAKRREDQLRDGAIDTSEHQMGPLLASGNAQLAAAFSH